MPTLIRWGSRAPEEISHYTEDGWKAVTVSGVECDVRGADVLIWEEPDAEAAPESAPAAEPAADSDADAH